MQLADVVAVSFATALADDNYPSEDIERLFGIDRGTPRGEHMLCIWKFLFKNDESVTTAAVGRALRTDTLPETCEKWVKQSFGTCAGEKARTNPWMRMVEFKFGCMQR
jgi:hypothetical protein